MLCVKALQIEDKIKKMLKNNLDCFNKHNSDL